MPPATKRRVAQSRYPPTPPRTRDGSRSGPSRAGSSPSRTPGFIPPMAESVANASPLFSPPPSNSPSPAIDHHPLQRTSSRDSSRSTENSSSSSASSSGASEYIPMQSASRMPSVSHAAYYTPIDGNSEDDALRTPEAPTDLQLMPPPTVSSRKKSKSTAKTKDVTKDKPKGKGSKPRQSKEADGFVFDPKNPPAHTPRPPNAWIIYRSDMLKAISSGAALPALDKLVEEQQRKDMENLEAMPNSDDNEDDVTLSTPQASKTKRKRPDPIPLPPDSAGALRLGHGKTGRGIPQAQISKLISAMWRNESPEVKRKYDRLSEQRKIEHLEKYPDYRFKPMHKDVKLKVQMAKAELRWRNKQERERMATRERQEREKAQMIYAQIRRKIRGGPPQVYVDDVNLDDPKYASYVKAFFDRLNGRQTEEAEQTPEPSESQETNESEGITRSRGPGSRCRTAVRSASPPPQQTDSADSAASPRTGSPAADSPPPDEPIHRRFAQGKSTVFWAADDYPHLPIPQGYEMPPFSAFPLAPPPPSPLVPFPPRVDTPRATSSKKSFPQPMSYPFSSRPATLAYGEPRSVPAPERGYLVVPAEPRHASDSEVGMNILPSERPAWHAEPIQQAPYAVPYTFEPIPLPHDMVVDSSMPYNNYPPDLYDQEMIDRESSSLAAMWCMLDEEDELEQGEQGYPVWDVDSNEAVNQWSSMEIPPETAQLPQSFILSSTVAEQIAAQWAQEQLVNPVETDLGEVRVTPFPDTGYLSYSFDAAQLAQRSTGPTVGGDIPLSPAEGLFPSDMTGQAMGDRTSYGNRRVSTTYSDFGVPPATPADLGLEADTPTLNFVRHVSNSAYPQPNMIDDPSECGTPAEMRDWAGTSSRYSAMPPASMSGTSAGDQADRSYSMTWEDNAETPRALTFNTGPAVGRRRGRVVASTYHSGASKPEQD